MDRLDAMTLLVSAVDEGSLAAAGRRHGRSAASVTRAVATLEALTGETLLLRSTRRLSITPAGERHLAIWRDVLARLGEIEPPDQDGTVQGRIVVTAPELFGRLKVVPIIERVLEEQPLVAARVLLLNRMVDLIGEGVDVAVRLAALPDSTLNAIRLGELRILVCAAPDYLAQVGAPTSPHDLTRHRCIGLDAEGESELWLFGPEGGVGSRLRSVRVSTQLSLNNAAAAIDAAIRGHGIIRARSYQVAEELAAGRLVRLLDGFEPPAVPAHLVFHADRGRRAAVRAFIDLAVPTLRMDLQRTAMMVSGSTSRRQRP